MLRSLYDRTMRLAGHRPALAMLGLVSFVDSSVFPIPPGVLRQLFAHPLTDKGLEAFLADWASTGQSILDS